MFKLIFSLILVVVGIGLGYLFQRSVDAGNICLKEGVQPIRKKLQQAALLFLNPIAIIGATWVVNLENMQIAVMPILGSIAILTGGILAFLLSLLFKMGRKQTGAYIVCGSFTNIGSLGALFCFMFLGEAGFALVPFYKLFEEFMYYTIGFPLAKSYSLIDSKKDSFLQRMKVVFTDIFVIVAVSAIGLGLLLNICNVPRPDFYATINQIFIPLAAFCLLLSIGMGMRFSAIKNHMLPSSCIVAIKFMCVPLLIGSLGYLFGLHQINGGLPLKVVIILSSMPVGFIAMIPPTLYDLDVDLANSCWLITNGLLLLQLPILLYVINTIG